MFIKYPQNPIIPRTKGSFYSIYSANPDILEFNGKLFYYFRGQGDSYHDQLGLAITDAEHFDGIHWEKIYPEPVIPVSTDPTAPDSNHILDPGSIVLNGKVYLYYSAYSVSGEYSVCLATSEDGIHFERSPKNPIIPNALAPEPVIKDGQLYLFYQRWTEIENQKAIVYLCTGNGTDFDLSQEQVVFTPPEGYVSISTNRIYNEDGWYYDFFGKNKRFSDYPESIGIARSKDLLHWEYSSQDVITRGEPGSWDEGALWFATVYKHNGRYYLWYEGTGTANGRKTQEDVRTSDIAINESYGGYSITNFSQIGLATYDGPLEAYFK